MAERPNQPVFETRMRYVDLRVVGPIATVSLKRDGGNRINFQMREEALLAFEQVATSPARALLVKGVGSDFCLGGDSREWIELPSAELRPRIEVFADALDVLDRLAIPTIAVVQGGCVGGGFELALTCDFIVAAASARFRFPEPSLGLVTLQGGVYLLAERIGRAKALELVMLSVEIGAAQMEAWNAVNRVVAEDALDAAAAELAERLASLPADAGARLKRLMRVWRDDGRPAARTALYDISMPAFDDPQVQRALAGAAPASDPGDGRGPSRAAT